MNHRRAALIVLSLLLLSGCAENATKISVEGSVTFQGKPIATAAIMFFPANGRPSTAAIDAEGSYSCRLATGDYRVTISPSVTLPVGWKEGDPVPNPAVTIPMRYTSRAKTPLTATITAETAGPLDFSLE